MKNLSSKIPIPRGMTVRREIYPSGDVSYVCNYCGHSCGWHPMYINHGEMYCDSLNYLAMVAEDRDIAEDSDTIVTERIKGV